MNEQQTQQQLDTELSIYSGEPQETQVYADSQHYYLSQGITNISTVQTI